MIPVYARFRSIVYRSNPSNNSKCAICQCCSEGDYACMVKVKDEVPEMTPREAFMRVEA